MKNIKIFEDFLNENNATSNPLIAQIGSVSDIDENMYKEFLTFIKKLPETIDSDEVTVFLKYAMEKDSEKDIISNINFEDFKIDLFTDRIVLNVKNVTATQKGFGREELDDVSIVRYFKNNNNDWDYAF